MPIELEPKAFDLLVLLIQSRPDVVTKQEIFDRIWAGTAVTDNALTRVVAQLRKALGDDARARSSSRPYRRAATGGCPSPTRPSRRILRLTQGDSVAGAWPSPASSIAAVAAIVVLVASRRQAAARLEPDAPIPMWSQQLTVSPGLDSFPTLSPDGRLIAYASNESGAFEIRVTRHERRRGRAPGDRRPAAERAACVVARRRAHRVSFAPLRRHLGRSGAGRRAAEDQRVRARARRGLPTACIWRSSPIPAPTFRRSRTARTSRP